MTHSETSILRAVQQMKRFLKFCLNVAGFFHAPSNRLAFGNMCCKFQLQLLYAKNKFIWHRFSSKSIKNRVINVWICIEKVSCEKHTQKHHQIETKSSLEIASSSYDKLSSVLCSNTWIRTNYLRLYNTKFNCHYSGEL